MKVRTSAVWLLALLTVADAGAACMDRVGRDLATAAPSEVGLSSEAWAAAVEALDAGRHEVRALLVVRGCKVVFERYKDGLNREHNHSVYSVTKSVTSTLVGALLYQGKLRSLDTRVSEVVAKPDRLAEQGWQNAQRLTLRNVMQMSSGLAYQHDPVNNPIYDTREDRLAFALSPEQQVAPGTRFLYSDGDVSITGAVVAAAAETDLLAFARRTLFEPMGMSNVAWSFKDRAGRYPGGWGLRLRPMDMAKLGQLYLQKGEWNGHRIFASEYLDAAWTAGPNAAYGLHWWIGSHANAGGTRYFFANGFKGQRIYVFPEHDAVVVVVASLPGREESTVMPLVIKALADSVAKGVDAPDSKTDIRLDALAKAGFRGVIRVPQENQDDPRRF
ncbi:beta-lactamase family protein [Ramlibacter sp. XY19]|uniref:serine hydrolase domain-containing protein n=1 Tax=Ramlibacter paludis TaxID=2908000 RepID=UPI0023DBF0E9|nr:serine hydrolase [Ramlibacter paludis]MCG2593784.1 beta-lactamase family protein [Ramlibacter paludis]